MSRGEIVIVRKHNGYAHKRVHDNARKNFMFKRETFFKTYRRENERQGATEHAWENNRADGDIVHAPDISRRNAVFSHFYRRKELPFGKIAEFALKNEHINNRNGGKAEISPRNFRRLFFLGFEMSETKQEIRAIEKPERNVATAFRDILKRNVYKRE